MECGSVCWLAWGWVGGCTCRRRRMGRSGRGDRSRGRRGERRIGRGRRTGWSGNGCVGRRDRRCRSLGLHRSLDSGLDGCPYVRRRGGGIGGHRLRDCRLDDRVYVRGRFWRGRLGAAHRQEERRGGQGQARQRSAPDKCVCKEPESVMDCAGCAHINLLLLDLRHTGLSYLHGPGAAGVHADLAEFHPAVLHQSPSRLDSEDYFPADQMVKSSNLVDFPEIPSLLK